LARKENLERREAKSDRYDSIAGDGESTHCKGEEEEPITLRRSSGTPQLTENSPTLDAVEAPQLSTDM